MSKCGPDCKCPDHRARVLLIGNGLNVITKNRKMVEALGTMIVNSAGRCPQSCGNTNWPDCGCPTSGMKDLVLSMSEEGKRLKRRGSRGLSIMEMMAAKTTGRG